MRPLASRGAMILFTISGGLFGLLLASIPVGIILILLSIALDAFFSPFPLMRGLGGQVVWSSSNSGGS